jgi:glycosyltransferase involved in cell wall biosynthesis
MNILFLDQFSDLGGAQRCLLDLLPAVRAHGWQAHVAAPGDGELRGRAVALGAKFHAIRCGPYESGQKSIGDVARFAAELPRLALEIARLARETRADIIYVNGPRLLAAAGFSSRPMVFHCHSYLGKGYAAALAGISLGSAQIIGSCNFVLEPLRPFMGPSQMEVVYNGVAVAGETACPTLLDQLDKPDGMSQPDKLDQRVGQAVSPARLPHTIGMIGRIAPEKGQLEFVQAARLLPSNWRFILCGAPLFSNPRYLELVREAAAGLPIEFLGWRENVAAVLSELNLLVVPSAPIEGTTRVILEAYAAGVPVVASASGGIPEIVRDGETGFLSPPGDPAKLAERIRTTLANPAALHTIAQNARRAWSERFTVAEYQRRILDILERVGSSARK